ncbi:hypothetical protein GF377_06275 [candidate division GN15 bacterium]|nr:hypothetical protein [candidate division GN15 bacterium]
MPDSAAEVPKLSTPDEYLKSIIRQREEIADFDTTATLYRYCWEIMHDIDTAIAHEFPEMVKQADEPKDVVVHDSFVTVNREQVYLGSGVKAGPGAIIDASDGPVFIGDFTRIEPQAAIYGPCYIGPNSVVVAGKIAGSSIGHTSRVGGEVEESVFQSYVNKYHAGFIGHSYVGSWVNFGAMTTNSDLKNNYSNIRVSLHGESIDTGSIKVGSFIGDHTKFGIGTLLNTGINIGVCCNIFGGSLIADKEIPSFRWGNSNGYQDYDIDKAIETMRRTAGRRGVDLSDQEEALLRSIAQGRASTEGALDWSSVLS